MLPRSETKKERIDGNGSSSEETTVFPPLTGPDPPEVGLIVQHKQRSLENHFCNNAGYRQKEVPLSQAGT